MQFEEGATGWLFYESISPKDHIRQGDLIEFKDRCTGDLNRYGLVVTADCDLDKIKHGRLITLIPVVSAKTIAECYLLIEQLDRQQAALTAFVRKELGLSGELTSPIFRAEMRSELTSLEADSAVCFAVKSLLNELDAISGKDFLSLMAAISVSTGKLPEKIQNQINSKGDLVMLPAPTFIEGESLEIAWVRPVWQEPIRGISLKNSEADKSEGVRIARLDSPFRYRVTQVLGQVFSDIGLPSDVKPDFSTIWKGMFHS